MKRLILILLLSGCTGNNSKNNLPDYTTSEVWSCDKTPEITRDINKSDLLVIGDSISIAYTPFIRQIKNDVNVLHNPCNAAWSGYTAYRINQYLELPYYEMIIFNNGIWDLTTSSISVDHYISNLRYTATKIKQRTSRPIFITSTYSVDAAKNPERWASFNERAVALMRELNIEVIDLFQLSYDNRHLLKNDGTHYIDQGSIIFAQEIVNHL